MVIEKVTLHWEGPIHFLDENKNYILDNKTVINSGGVYLWTIECENRYYPMYVGITKNFYNRFCEYLSKMFYGNYWLYDFSEIKRILSSGQVKKEPLYKASTYNSFNK